VSATDLGAELLELVAPFGDEALLARIDPTRCEADLQAEQDSPQAAAADLAARSLG
jgi:hypothetical protein